MPWIKLCASGLGNIPQTSIKSSCLEQACAQAWTVKAELHVFYSKMFGVVIKTALYEVQVRNQMPFPPQFSIWWNPFHPCGGPCFSPTTSCLLYDLISSIELKIQSWIPNFLKTTSQWRLDVFPNRYRGCWKFLLPKDTVWFIIFWFSSISLQNMDYGLFNLRNYWCWSIVVSGHFIFDT
jgi:hypothetical protein